MTRKDLLHHEVAYEPRTGRRNAVRKLCHLSLDDKVEIVERVVVQKESHKDVARAFGLSSQSVTSFMSKVRRKQEYMAELIDRALQNV